MLHWTGVLADFGRVSARVGRHSFDMVAHRPTHSSRSAALMGQTLPLSACIDEPYPALALPRDEH